MLDNREVRIMKNQRTDYGLNSRIQNSGAEIEHTIYVIFCAVYRTPKYKSPAF